MNYLEANHIVKQYANHKALDDVTVHVPENSIYGLLGPNGAGKTTLIRIINQITGPDSGEVLIDGRPAQPSDVEHIGYLPEERGLYKKMKVGEQILYLSQLKGLSRNEAKTRMQAWLRKFDIEGWEKKKIEELSKGMQQKIQFITTVIHRPMMNRHRTFFIYRRILNEQYRNQHRHLPDCQKADRQDHLYRPCPFQPDRKRDNGGQNQAYAP